MPVAGVVRVYGPSFKAGKKTGVEYIKGLDRTYLLTRATLVVVEQWLISDAQ